MTSHNSIILAVTGGIACGKSEVGRILQQNGFDVLDTDKLAHELMRAGGPVFNNIMERFGESVVSADGEIDRGKLGKIVFENPGAREVLNEMVHPAVIETTEQWKAKQTGDAAVLVPLLFEAEWTEGWSAIICVSADEEKVLDRLAKRGLNLEEARSRIAAQMPLGEKEKRADFILKNNETLDALSRETLKVLQAVRSRGKDHE